MVKTFEICPGKKTGHIFMYTITISFKGSTICVYQVLTEIHTQEFIEFWLKSFKRLGASTPRRTISDYERGIPMSCCLAFNDMSFKEYIDTCFAWALSGNNDKSCPVNTLIRIDVAHLMHLVATWKCVKNERHETVKNTRLYCVALMVDVQTVAQFARIFLLTSIISLHPFSDTILMIDGVKMKVSEALHELEDAIGNRRKKIQNLQASMISYEKSKEGERIADFEEGEGGTETHKFIKKLIKKASSSEMEGKIVNGFYNADFVNGLERLGKEFPAWTGVTEPESQVHASSAYQEGYFARLRNTIGESVKLPCSTDRFVSEHLKTLQSGTNLLGAELKHANHKREPPPPPAINNSEGIPGNYGTIPCVPQSKFHLADDSDLKSYEPWGGLKNKDIFCIGNESSEEDGTRTEENDKAAPSDHSRAKTKVFVKDTSNFPDSFRKYGRDPNIYEDNKHDASTLRNVSMDKNAQEFHPSQNEVSGGDDLNFLSFTTKLTDTTHCITREEPEIEISNTPTQKEFTLMPDKGQAPDPSPLKASLPPPFTSTPILDHSYALRTDLDKTKILEDLTNWGNLNSQMPGMDTHPTEGIKQVNTRICNETLPPDVFVNENLVDSHCQNLITNIQACKRKMVNIKEHGQKKKIKNNENLGDKPVGHYFQDFKEIRIMNRRLKSKKKGLLFPNGNNCIRPLRIKLDNKIQWKLDPAVEKEFVPREIKVRALNTCGLDSILHVLQFCVIDHALYESFAEDSGSPMIKLHSTVGAQIERLQLLNMDYYIKQSGVPLYPYFLDALDYFDIIWKRFLADEARGYKSFNCNQKDCTSDPTLVHLISVNENTLRKGGYEDLQVALQYHPIISKKKCRRKKCGGECEEYTTLNAHICISLDIREKEDGRKTMEGQLNAFPHHLYLEKVYRLAGIIHHQPSFLPQDRSQLPGPGHFSAFCLRISGSWIHCDDLSDTINYTCKPSHIVKPHAAIYVISETE